MAELAGMCEVYFTNLERQAARLEKAASQLEMKDKKAILEIVSDLRADLQTFQEQVDLCAEWG